MRVLFAALATVVALCGAAVADDGPVVVELFTSQGCSSCPPAHDILDDLTKDDRVIVLALHVDYWDYLGWRDIFGSPQYSDRQHAYARAAGQRTVYTPQFIIEGQDHIIGARVMDVMASIRAHDAADSGVDIAVQGSGDMQTVVLAASTAEPMVVQLVRYEPHRDVDVLGGENAGRLLSYSNIVTQWDIITEWDGAAPLLLDVEVTGPEPAVIIVQSVANGPILASARIDR